jgi:hypothetical protein
MPERVDHLRAHAPDRHLAGDGVVQRLLATTVIL